MLLSCAVTSHHKIFSADADVRLARRIRRDTVEKGRDIGTVLDQVMLLYATIDFPLVTPVLMMTCLVSPGGC